MTVRTPLYDIHQTLGARFVDFHGYEMPIEYTGIIAEHEAVRSGVGMFDISHMGQVKLTGKQSHPFLQNLITNDVRKLIPGKALYTPMCNYDGGIVDDIIVYMVKDDEYILVVNSATTEKDVAWITDQAEDCGVDVCVEDLSPRTGMIAVQGPHAARVLEDLMACSLTDMGRYSFCATQLAEHEVIVSRTGYTGEDGFEIFTARDEVTAVWDKVMHSSGGKVVPVGLGARNTLRLEACYLLYGSDMDDDTTPLEAGLKWTVSFSKGDFIGRDALLQQEANGLERKLVSFEMLDRGIPREGYTLCSESGAAIGNVTSGSFCPTLQKNLALGYVTARYSEPGTVFAVDIRGRQCAAQVVTRPFYRKPI